MTVLLQKIMRVRNEKKCDICKKPFVELFRFKVVGESRWSFACKSCLKEEKNKDRYLYGGTWKKVKN